MANWWKIHNKEVRFIPTEFGRFSIHLELDNTPYQDPCAHYSPYYNCLLQWHVPTNPTISIIPHAWHNGIISIIIHGSENEAIPPQLYNLFTSKEDRFGWERESEIGSICGVRRRRWLTHPGISRCALSNEIQIWDWECPTNTITVVFA